MLLNFLLVGSCSVLLGCGESPSNALPDRVSNDTSTAKSQPAPTSGTNEQRGSPVEKKQGQPETNSIFDPILSELQQKTRVPLRLPTYLATEEEENPLYAIVETATTDHYELQLAFTKTCTGGNVCHYGIVSGQAAKPSERREKGRSLPLVQGITGYFVDAKCGANCPDSTLTWEQDGYRYSVGIKAADMETLTKVANSAISR
jgi:hypothetical protein